MKRYIFNLFLKIFAKELSSHLDAKRIYESRKRTIQNYPLGTKVICRSNEAYDLLIGVVSKHTDFGPNKEILLQITDNDGQVFCPIDNHPHIWSKEKEEALRKLNWAEQWNVMGPGYVVISKEDKKRSEERVFLQNPTKLTKNI